ncbi:hypothetical protein M917_1301 [Psychrobacter aquaticus CMS 56]|uniref:Uncharacterized protein n=1 Tax=Psychrobacter aquaticus CMS 56 TaxID=1354303 RepID=U4TAN0_9GAMM|nr:hypothetical protein M917_1301 [Psychrobacter aquaticus CMS 56]
MLPNENSATKVANRCLLKGVVLVLGSAFSKAKNAKRFLSGNM